MKSIQYVLHEIGAHLDDIDSIRIVNHENVSWGPINKKFPAYKDVNEMKEGINRNRRTETRQLNNKYLIRITFKVPTEEEKTWNVDLESLGREIEERNRELAVLNREIHFSIFNDKHLNYWHAKNIEDIREALDELTKDCRYIGSTMTRRISPLFVATFHLGECIYKREIYFSYPKEN